MSSPKKLYCITTSECTLPLHVTPNGVRPSPAHDVPQILWPDGTVCWLVNLYLLKGYRKGRSRLNNGGTLLTWAKNLSHLVRWCYENTVDFTELTDSHFKMFVNALLAQKDEVQVSEKKRGPEQVSYICSTVLNFLAFVDERMPGLNLLGPNGRILAEKKSFQVRSSRTGRTITRTAWVHEHVPQGRRTRRRQPISASAVDRLYEANSTQDASSYVGRRRYIMLRLLEITGGRRIELAFIKVSDLEEAARTGELKLFDAKQRDTTAVRYVPVTQADLKDILSFVKHYRLRVIRSTIGTSKDHGVLFVSERTGRPLAIDTLGAELRVLRLAAGIFDEEACLHAFRHRFITNIFREIIKTHHCENVSDVRHALQLSAQTLKVKVMEWTGHKSVESLDHYIHLAFEAESRFQEDLDLLKAKNVVKSLQLMLKDYSAQFRSPKPARSSFLSLVEVVDAAASELDALLKPLGEEI